MPRFNRRGLLAAAVSFMAMLAFRRGKAASALPVAPASAAPVLPATPMPSVPDDLTRESFAALYPELQSEAPRIFHSNWKISGHFGWVHGGPFMTPAHRLQSVKSKVEYLLTVPAEARAQGKYQRQREPDRKDYA